MTPTLADVLKRLPSIKMRLDIEKRAAERAGLGRSLDVDDFIKLIESFPTLLAAEREKALDSFHDEAMDLCETDDDYQDLHEIHRKLAEEVEDQPGKDRT